MSNDRTRWKIDITHAADRDFVGALKWSKEMFGARQAAVYGTTLTRAIQALRAGPGIPGARLRTEIGKGLLTLHVARSGRRGRHLLLFRVVDAKSRRLEVLRVLHDSMDLQRHLEQ